MRNSSHLPIAIMVPITQDAARALVEMRARPDLAPGAAGDEILPLGVEGGLVGVGPIDPGSAQDLAARIRAAS